MARVVPPEPGPSSTMLLVPILGTMVGIMIFFNIWHMEAAMFNFLEFNCGLHSLIKQAFWEVVIVY
jgi:hypothetical protein